MNKYNVVFLGQSVIKYEVPLDVHNTINNIYSENVDKLLKANNELVGKIDKEHVLFYDGPEKRENQNKQQNQSVFDIPRGEKYNVLPKNVLDYFTEAVTHYLNWNKIKDYQTHLNSIWINEMKEHEYNPVHVHQGSLFTGLSSVMILKLPESFGVEYSAAEAPHNGKLQFLGSASGYFANIDFQPRLKERDFYIFPYDLRHCVYPFNGPGKRRTLAANIDVKYDPIKNRGV